MAVLDESNRRSAWAEFMNEEGAVRNPIGITKADLRSAVNAVDDWVEANQTAFNTAIPQPARGSLTTKQKARLLMLVAGKRFGVSA